MRSYGDPCGVARALDAIGERWALLIVRELLLGPKRFTDLHRGLGAVSQNVLSQRLRELEEAGIVERRRLGYELTPRGAALEPVLIALGRWGRERPLPDAGGELSADALMLALRTTFDPEAAGSLRAALDVRLDDDTFTVAVADRSLTVRRGSAPHPDATVRTDARTLRDVAFGRASVDAVEIDGDAAAARRLLAAFA
jgi:DNA-binding HxlR family transcriptional regulator